MERFRLYHAISRARISLLLCHQARSSEKEAAVGERERWHRDWHLEGEC